MEDGGAGGEEFLGVAADGAGSALVPEGAHEHGDAGDDAVDDGAADEFVAEFFGEALEDFEGFFFGVIATDDGAGDFCPGLRDFFAESFCDGAAESEIHDG